MNRVGINLLWLVPGTVGGSETYLARLLSGLAERSSELDYTIFALREFADAHPELVGTFQTHYAPVRGQVKPFRILGGENSWLAVQCKIRKIDLVHHAGGTLPFVRTARPVLTIHDLQYLFYPEYFSRTKLTWLRVAVPRSAESARLILTPSEFTRRTVIERLNIDPAFVSVVPHGISPHDGREPTREIRTRYDLNDPFFIYPAITYPHKNHLVLIEAFARVTKLHPEVKLVLTGGRGSMETKITATIRSLGIEDRVKRLGWVPRRDLDALYHHAEALVFPSRFEGFGAPLLEAMTRDCPVIAADATALPEVVQEAGLLVSPDNPDEWARAMSDVLEDRELHARLTKAGSERAAEFNWGRSADILEDAYLHVLETTL